MPRKTSTRRTGAADRSRATTEDDYERSQKREMALADLSNEVEKRIKAINYEAQQAVNFLQSTYAHCLNFLTQEEKTMLWVDYEARRKRDVAASCDGGSTCKGDDKAGDLGTMAKKILNDINVVIPEDDAPPADRRARRKRPAKAMQRAGEENEVSESKTRRVVATEDGSETAAAAAASVRPAAVGGATKTVPRAASTMIETPAHVGLQFKYLCGTMSNTERRPKPLEKIALTSATTGSPLVLEQRVCVLVDGQDVLNLKSGDISEQDIQYLQSVLTSLQERSVEQKQATTKDPQ